MRSLAYSDDLPLVNVPSLAALACQQGDVWWTLLPLKKDTTFQAVYEVRDGTWSELLAPEAVDDDQLPELGKLMDRVTPVGLATKADAMARWCQGLTPGSSDTLKASAVAWAARSCEAGHWSDALPAYHRKSAPELQRGL